MHRHLSTHSDYDGYSLYCLDKYQNKTILTDSSFHRGLRSDEDPSLTSTSNFTPLPILSVKTPKTGLVKHICDEEEERNFVSSRKIVANPWTGEEGTQSVKIEHPVQNGNKWETKQSSSKGKINGKNAKKDFLSNQIQIYGAKWVHADSEK
jgi:hypothetical protein